MSRNFTPSAGYVHNRVENHLHEPLEASQCTQHHNTDRQTIPQASKSNVTIDSGHSSHGTLTSYQTVSKSTNPTKKAWSTHPSDQHSTC
jgi:hypothetical protein